MNVKYYLGLNALTGLLIALTPFVLFPVCSQTKIDGSHMACYYSGIVIMLLGIVIVLCSLAAILSSRFIMLSLSVSAICALLCWLIPNESIQISGVGLCSNLEHACRAVTMPKTGMFAALIIFISIAGSVINFVKRG